MGHVGSKGRSLGQIEGTCLLQQFEILSEWYLGQFWIWVVLTQKLIQCAKLKENLVNTVEGAFFASAAYNLVRMFILMISRPGLYMDYAGSKTKLGQIEGKSEAWNFFRMFVWMISRSSSKLVIIGSETRYRYR